MPSTMMSSAEFLSTRGSTTRSLVSFNYPDPNMQIILGLIISGSTTRLFFNQR
jgi:hypothetical protein